VVKIISLVSSLILSAVCSIVAVVIVAGSKPEWRQVLIFLALAVILANLISIRTER